jgi:hypothetical protein
MPVPLYPPPVKEGRVMEVFGIREACAIGISATEGLRLPGFQLGGARTKGSGQHVEGEQGALHSVTRG